MHEEGFLDFVARWAAPVLTVLLGLFIRDHMQSNSNQHTKTQGEVGSLQVDMAAVKKDIEHIKKTVDKDDKEFDKKVAQVFENQAVTVIKNARKKLADKY